MPGSNGSAATPEPSPWTEAPFEALGDFTADRRLLFISGLGLLTGMLGSCLAYLLLKLIALCTNLFYFQTFSTGSNLPSHAHLGAWMVLIPMTGSMIVGLMARYGSERIRGHGIPEAIEAILVNGSRVNFKVAVLKPISAAISIGSGGPFGAEGPIIMTGGSFGSLLAQAVHLSDNERKTLLVAGAAAGMSAVFATPLAAVLLAVELLLFEWKPRSLIPVAVSSVTSFMLRHYLLGAGPLFPVPPHPSFVAPVSILLCVVVGISGGALSAALTAMVYFAEDSFLRLPLHWMWWPLLGGFVIGIGGLISPRALGVGYDTIGANLNGELTLKIAISVLLVKAAIWSISLGSGTSGGVVAPLLLMGSSLGVMWAQVLPDNGVGFWPLIAMAAVLGGAMRLPLTAVVFSIELTHDFDMLVPLIAGVLASYAFTVLTLKRSILTEKISRRGYHLSREYSVDPLELALVRDFMTPDFVSVAADAPRDAVERALVASDLGLVIFTSDGGRLSGALTDADLRRLLEETSNDTLCEVLHVQALQTPVGYLREPLRAVAHRMATTGKTRLPVVDPHTGRAVGVLTLEHLLAARGSQARSDTDRSRHIGLSLFNSRGEG